MTRFSMGRIFPGYQTGNYRLNIMNVTQWVNELITVYAGA